MSRKENALSNMFSKIDVLQVVEAGMTIMDKLQAAGIKEATFENGSYFRNGKKNRALASKGTILIETDDEVLVQIAKEGASSDSIATADDIHITQKMRGAYGGRSQSDVSKKRQLKKKNK